MRVGNVEVTRESVKTKSKHTKKTKKDKKSKKDKKDKGKKGKKVKNIEKRKDSRTAATARANASPKIAINFGRGSQSTLQAAQRVARGAGGGGGGGGGAGPGAKQPRELDEARIVDQILRRIPQPMQIDQDHSRFWKPLPGAAKQQREQEELKQRVEQLENEAVQLRVPKRTNMAERGVGKMSISPNTTQVQLPVPMDVRQPTPPQAAVVAPVVPMSGVRATKPVRAVVDPNEYVRELTAFRNVFPTTGVELPQQQLASGRGSAKSLEASGVHTLGTTPVVIMDPAQARHEAALQSSALPATGGREVPDLDEYAFQELTKEGELQPRQQARLTPPRATTPRKEPTPIQESVVLPVPTQRPVSADAIQKREEQREMFRQASNITGNRLTGTQLQVDESAKTLPTPVQTATPFVNTADPAYVAHELEAYIGAPNDRNVASSEARPPSVASTEYTNARSEAGEVSRPVSAVPSEYEDAESATGEATRPVSAAPSTSSEAQSETSATSKSVKGVRRVASSPFESEPARHRSEKGAEPETFIQDEKGQRVPAKHSVQHHTGKEKPVYSLPGDTGATRGNDGGYDGMVKVGPVRNVKGAYLRRNLQYRLSSLEEKGLGFSEIADKLRKALESDDANELRKAQRL